jgi:hypothetical protein
MTKESIEQRKIELQKQLEQTQATGNAIVGAIQDCDYWLTELSKENENA